MAGRQRQLYFIIVLEQQLLDRLQAADNCSYISYKGEGS